METISSPSHVTWQERRLRGQGQVMPLAVDGSHLKNLALVRVEKIIPVGNSSYVLQTDGTSRPSRRTERLAILRSVFRDVDSVAYSVGNSGWARWH
jgi:hypothetical protein